MDLEQLEKLNTLKEKGIISQAEFEIKKQELLNNNQQTILKNNTTDTDTDKSIIGYSIECVSTKFACFKGRARRKEYWGFALVTFLIQFVIGFIAGFTGSDLTILNNIISLIILLPYLGVLVRRLHDVNMSGWWILTLVVPLVVIFFKSDLNENKYGPVPAGVK